MLHDRQATDALASCGEDRIGNRRRNGRQSGFPRTAQRLAVRIDDAGCDVRRVGHAQHLVIMEIALFHPTLLKRDPAIERRCQPVDNAAFHLRSKAIWVHDMKRPPK